MLLSNVILVLCMSTILALVRHFCWAFDVFLKSFIVSQSLANSIVTLNKAVTPRLDMYQNILYRG
jgi:hypothetical protein